MASTPTIALKVAQEKNTSAKDSKIKSTINKTRCERSYVLNNTNISNVRSYAEAVKKKLSNYQLNSSNKWYSDIPFYKTYKIYCSYYNNYNPNQWGNNFYHEKNIQTANNFL